VAPVFIQAIIQIVFLLVHKVYFSQRRGERRITIMQSARSVKFLKAFNSSNASCIMKDDMNYQTYKCATQEKYNSSNVGWQINILLHAETRRMSAIISYNPTYLW